MSVPPHLTHRPAVHQLCSGIFIQETLHLRSNVSAVPLQPLGFDAEAKYTALYAKDIVGAQVDHPNYDALRGHGASARPAVALVVRLSVDAPPELLEREAERILIHARSVLGWVSGDRPEPFALVTATLRDTYFRLTPPVSRRRQRLGFGNTGLEYQALLGRILRCAEEDQHFAFALALYRDALRDDSPEFRVARFFSCLEALAYRLKKGRGSRAAVRYLLGLEGGALTTIGDGERQYRYDRVEIGGRIRDKLFHGVPFTAEELTDEARAAYEVLKQNEDQLRDMLQTDCELEIARWANGASRGLTAGDNASQ